MGSKRIKVVTETASDAPHATINDNSLNSVAHPHRPDPTIVEVMLFFCRRAGEAQRAILAIKFIKHFIAICADPVAIEASTRNAKADPGHLTCSDVAVILGRERYPSAPDQQREPAANW